MEYLSSRKHHQEDELDAFFKSMASTKAKLKCKIHELVYRAEMETMYEASCYLKQRLTEGVSEAWC